jgi:hypothetical protein
VIVCTRLHWFGKRDDGRRGIVNLHLPEWRLSLLGVQWTGDAILLPRRQWLKCDLEQEAELLLFGDRGAQQRFEQAALTAIDDLERRSRRR